MRELLTTIVTSENIYGKEVSEEAEKCLKFADDVIKQCEEENDYNGR